MPWQTLQSLKTTVHVVSSTEDMVGSNSVKCTTNARNQTCFAFCTEWSDLSVICFSMMAIWCHFFMHSDAYLVRIWWGFDSTNVMQIWHDLASRCVILWRWIIAITVPRAMACNEDLYLAPNTQTCLFLRSGIVIFAPAGAVFIAIIKLWCLTSLWCMHWLTNSHARMGMHQVAWSSMEMPRKCHGKSPEVAPKYSRDFVKIGQIICFR